MTVEQIAIRQEIRQMLNEAGINKNTLKDMVKEVLNEELQRAIRQAFNETDVDAKIRTKLNDRADIVIRDELRREIASKVSGVFNRMTISVDITDKNGQTSITR
jgi:hypothetical protein